MSERHSSPNLLCAVQTRPPLHRLDLISRLLLRGQVQRPGRTEPWHRRQILGCKQAAPGGAGPNCRPRGRQAPPTRGRRPARQAGAELWAGGRAAGTHGGGHAHPHPAAPSRALGRSLAPHPVPGQQRAAGSSPLGRAGSRRAVPLRRPRVVDALSEWESEAGSVGSGADGGGAQAQEPALRVFLPGETCSHVRLPAPGCGARAYVRPAPQHSILSSILVSIFLFYTVIEHSVMVSARGCPGSTCISPVWLERCKLSLSLSGHTDHPCLVPLRNARNLHFS